MTEKTNKIKNPLEDDVSYELYRGETKNLPSTFMLSRPLVQRKLDEGEKDYQKLSTITGDAVPEFMEELSSIGKNGLSKVVFRLLPMALGKALYNTSYLMGNTERGTGLATDKLSDGRPNLQVIYKGHSGYMGEISVKLSELASEVFGVKKPSNKQKKEILCTLHAMEGIFINDEKVNNGKRKQRKLISVDSIETDVSTNAKELHIYLHPIFALSIANNFAAHPQNIIQMLRRDGKRITDTTLDMLDLLSLHDKRKTYTIFLDDMIRKIGIVDMYAKDKKKGEQMINRAIEDMIHIGIIEREPKVEELNDKRKRKYIFTLNPNYAKTPKIVKGVSMDDNQAN